MTKGTNIEAIEKATGKSWNEWLEYFEKINAKKLTHKEIAQKVYDDGTPGWWSQAVTVAYEQHIGRRKPGQDNKGEFSVSVTKTLPGSMDEALDSWLDFMSSRKELSDVTIIKPGEVSKTDKWRYWRCELANGSKINVTIYQKSDDKASLAVTNEKLSSAEQAEMWRNYWKKELEDL